MNRKFAALAVVSAMVLGACGSDNSTPDTTMPSDTTMAPSIGTGTVVQVALGTDGFETLVAAVTAAGLITTLSGDGPFTVFAPTDDAFAALPEGLLAKLLLPKNKAVLQQILTYHVVAGKLSSADLAAGTLDSVEGSKITVTLVDGKPVLNGAAKILIADVPATNGVIHAIDAIILPPGLDPSSL